MCREGIVQVERKYAPRLKVADYRSVIFGPQKRASRPITLTRSFPSNAPILPQLDNAVAGAPKREHGEIEHSPEAIHIWISQLTTRFAGRPIAVCVEQSRGALLFALSKYDNLVLLSDPPSGSE